MTYMAIALNESINDYDVLRRGIRSFMVIVLNAIVYMI